MTIDTNKIFRTFMLRTSACHTNAAHMHCLNCTPQSPGESFDTLESHAVGVGFATLTTHVAQSIGYLVLISDSPNSISFAIYLVRVCNRAKNLVQTVFEPTEWKCQVRFCSDPAVPRSPQH
jgi:hypothetical protein